MKYGLYQYLMIALWIVGILIIIYVVRLIIKALRKYTKSAPIRKEKVENARTLGEVLKQHRVGCKMTQEFVAETLGVSRQSVSKWERGICLPDVSVYLELCEILGISLNEFLAGEDIERDNIEKKSEDTLIQITKDSGRKQRYLKRIIIVLLIVVGISMVTFGSIVCNKLRQPQNYIEAVDSDSVEMKTAELLSGIDGTMMFRYNSKDTFQALYVYLSEYHSGKRVSHKRVLELSYEDVKSAKNGLIVITPDFDNFTAKLIAADGVRI